MVETLKRREINNNELESSVAELLNYLNDNGANVKIETEMYENQIEQHDNIFNAVTRFGVNTQKLTINIYEHNASTFDLYGFLDYTIDNITEDNLDNTFIDERYKYAYAHHALALSDNETNRSLYESLCDSMINNHAHVSEILDPIIKSGELNDIYASDEMQAYKDKCRNQYRNVAKQKLFIKDLLTKYERGLK